MRKLKIAFLIIVALGAFALGYFVGKPAAVKLEPNVEVLKQDAKIAIDTAEVLSKLQQEAETKRIAAEVDRAKAKQELMELKAKAAQEVSPVGTQGAEAKDAYIAGLEKYAGDLEQDKEKLKSEVVLLKQSNEKLRSAIDSNEKAFDAYKISKEAQIANLKSEAGTGKLKAFAWGFVAGAAADRAVSVALKLRF